VLCARAKRSDPDLGAARRARAHKPPLEFRNKLGSELLHDSSSPRASFQLYTPELWLGGESTQLSPATRSHTQRSITLKLCCEHGAVPILRARNTISAFAADAA